MWNSSGKAGSRSSPSLSISASSSFSSLSPSTSRPCLWSTNLPLHSRLTRARSLSILLALLVLFFITTLFMGYQTFISSDPFYLSHQRFRVYTQVYSQRNGDAFNERNAKEWSNEWQRRLSSNPRSLCGCPQKLTEPTFNVKTKCLPSQFTHDSTAMSTCNDEATFHGPGQKVLTFSLFGNASGSAADFARRYFPGLRRNLDSRPHFYPDWLIRIYHNLTLDSSDSQLCPFVCGYENLFFCDVRKLPGEIGNVENVMNPRTWRFLALGDPTIDIFQSRDLDSDFFQRDLDAVNQWLRVSDSMPLHGMRDHPLHASRVMGGLWGANHKSLGRNVAHEMRREMIKTDWRKLNLSDEDLLAKVVYSKREKSVGMLIHDSYNCEKWGDSVPFPSQRNVNFEFAGFPFKISNQTTFYPLPECPKACRPPHGQNWTFC